MSLYVDSFFTHVLDYINLLYQAEIIKYLLSFMIVVMVLGLLGRLLHVNDRKGV